jgi:hypothetical protein
MITTLFLGFVALMAAVVVALSARYQLWIGGLSPKMLTFAGANVDIYVGASAPRIAWLSTRGRSGMKFALIWNVLGLFAYSFDASSDVMAVGPDRVPGIASIVENASREPLPRADPKRFSIAVAHLS